MYKINKYAAPTPEFGVWSKGFSEDEIDKIVFLEKVIKFIKAGVGEGDKTQVNPNIRDSKVAFIPVDQQTEWIWQRLAGIIPRANYDLFLYDIDSIQSLQYTIYSSKSKQFYDWHTDSGGMYMDYVRKISGTILLTDPDEYEGGEFEIINKGGNPAAADKFKPNKGDVVLFASHMPHKVHPITKGTRKSLVFWVVGKRQS
jgi:PKHD-type hydroxylase